MIRRRRCPARRGSRRGSRRGFVSLEGPQSPLVPGYPGAGETIDRRITWMERSLITTSGVHFKFICVRTAHNNKDPPSPTDHSYCFSYQLYLKSFLNCECVSMVLNYKIIVSFKPLSLAVSPSCEHNVGSTDVVRYPVSGIFMPGNNVVGQTQQHGGKNS